jgi:mitotic spindle assembly checkpoint protein MAD1
VSAQLEEAQTALQTSHRSNRDDADSATLRSELARQAAYTRTLEASQVRLESELSKLRKKEGVIAVVEEKLRGAERKVEHMSVRVGELEGEKIKLERELRELKKVLERTQNMGGGAGDASFASMKDDVSDISAVDASTTAALSRLRLQHATLLDELSTTRATLSATTAQLSSLSAQLEETKKEVDEKTTELEAEKEGKKRLERRVRDVEGEVEFLRAMVVSYQQEQQQVQQQVQQPQDGGLATPYGLDGTANSAHIAALTTQLTHLTSLTVSLQASNKDLHAELDAMSAKVKVKETTGEQVRELKAELDDLRSRTLQAETELAASQTELADLTAQLEAAEQRLFELTGAIAAGTHVPPGVRVLSMAGNPAQKWAEERKEAVERLRRENEALLGRVKVLEDQLEGAGGVGAGAAMTNAATGGPHEDLVPRESWAAEREERERLEDVVKQREKRLVRLQDVSLSTCRPALWELELEYDRNRLSLPCSRLS